MDKSLLEIFDNHLSHIKFNAHLAKEFYRFQIGFVNKNEEHMAFFGGNLLGVHVVRFTERDFKVFFDDILDIDPLAIKEEFKDIRAIDPNWKVSNDVFNMCCQYLIHRFLTTPLMDEKSRERAAIDVALIFNYRCITALLAGYFKYPADPKAARATYVALSYRFLIKRLGSWQEVLYYRSVEMTKKDGLHRDTYIKFKDDYSIVVMVNDHQGRIRDMVKNIYAEFKRIHDSGERIFVNSSTDIDADGVEIVKDKVHGLENYTTYLQSIISDKNSFIKQELVNVVVKVMHTMQSRGFLKVLNWLSDNYSSDSHQELDELIKTILIYSFNYLLENGHVVRDSKDIVGFLTKLKGMYVSSRSSSEDLIHLRDEGSKIITRAIGKTNEQSVAAIRTGLFLYICLRAYTKHYYTNH